MRGLKNKDILTIPECLGFLYFPDFPHPKEHLWFITFYSLDVQVALLSLFFDIHLILLRVSAERQKLKSIRREKYRNDSLFISFISLKTIIP